MALIPENQAACLLMCGGHFDAYLPTTSIDHLQYAAKIGCQDNIYDFEESDSSCDTHESFLDFCSPNSLDCEESLEESPIRQHNQQFPHDLLNDDRSRPVHQPSTSPESSPCAPTCLNSDVISKLIRNEALRQAEVQTSWNYIHRHPDIDEAKRSEATRWLAELVRACNLRRQTLYQAVSFLDRFLSSAKDVPMAMLQLIATASLSLAAKQEEVVYPTVKEWVEIADNAFMADDLIRAEWLIFQHLEMRLRTPTAYSFLHLFCCGMTSKPTQQVMDAACYMLELSILDYKMQQYDYSTVAAAALCAAHQLLGLQLGLDDLADVAPFLSVSDVNSCAVLLWTQHKHSTAAMPARNE